MVSTIEAVEKLDDSELIRSLTGHAISEYVYSFSAL